ncbi:oligosaccharide flippase family protein [Serratia proteamaculans]|uniref:oligosaccharide flippase family protein n=1 Tax=Serratia proteamaculans TaxID=28151 RepID=UPI00217A6574|nr:oligosaccharide flippase family protein [Serratia proteamaculans]CAI1534775.1 Lipopolysaccharide biosynthesis protein wzxC [Serratia proteamaculans]
MGNLNLSKKVKSAALWSALEALSSSLLSVISIIFLARILIPEDYGQIATAQIIAALVLMLLSFGITEAVIQKKDLKPEHMFSAFWGSLVLATVGFLVCAAIAAYFNLTSENKNIPIILLFEGIGVFLNLLVMLPTALLLRNLEMSAFTKRTIFSRLMFFAVAVPMALKGFGLWSIVFANLVQVVIATVLVFYAARKLLPRGGRFSQEHFFELTSFGVFVMIENLLWSVMSRVFSLLIFNFHGTSALGLFNMATRLTDAILAILNTVVGRIALPLFSSVQHDTDKLKLAFKKATFIFNLVSMPGFFGIALTCEHWLPIVLGEQWRDAIPVIQIIAVMNGIMFSRTFVGTLMKAIGESRRFLYLSAVAAATTVVAAVATRDMSLIDTIGAWSAARVLITIPVGIWLMNKIFGMTGYQQLSPVLVPFVSSLFMAGVIVATSFLIEKYTVDALVLSVAQITIGAISYAIVCLLLNKAKLITATIK